MPIHLSHAFNVGSLSVTALSDGVSERTQEMFFDRAVPESEWVAALGLASAAEERQFSATSYLIRGSDLTTLVDPGYGAVARTTGMVGGGELPLRLAEAGIAPSEVDRVVITHLHAEHFCWLIDEDHTDEPLFPNAQAFVHTAELAYWTSDAPTESRMTTRIRSVLDRIEAHGLLQTFEGEFPVAAEVTMLPMPGHTPGHSVVRVASGADQLLITGDLAYNTAHLEHAGWIPAAFNVDGAQAARSREAFIALALEHNAVIAIGHSAIPTLGRLTGTVGQPRWTPV